jgi:hypothetical protein
MTRPFCASCCSDGPGLHLVRLDDGGPDYLFCERCDSGIATTDPGRMPAGVNWPGARYFPLDELERSVQFRILRALRRFDWIRSDELFDTLSIPGTTESRLERGRYSAALSRYVRERYVEVKTVTARAIRKGYSRRHAGLHQWKEYRITPLGIARLEWMLQGTMAPAHRSWASRAKRQARAA